MANGILNENIDRMLDGKTSREESEKCEEEAII